MNQKTLVIVESPAKSNTISKYLGDDYIVSSSMGHVRDLSPHILSIDIDDNYRPHYEELTDKKAIIKKLKDLSKKSKVVLLGPDLDREGEAIAFHLKELLKSDNKEIYRIVFNEITRKSILESIKNPSNIDQNKVNSQQMRRLLDRLAGYKISPILQKKIGGPLSAGRVQSIALKLIVEKEKNIMAFQPEEYWIISAELEGSQKPVFSARLEKFEAKKLKITEKQQSEKILEALKKEHFELMRIDRRTKKSKPLPPLITSTLQQEAYKMFKFPVKKTMKIAQQLYEGFPLEGGEASGLITYMRTDSYRISNEARSEAKNLISKEFGKNFCPDQPNFFSKKSKSQDAHEAIRPTVPLKRPEQVKKFLSDVQYKIYNLIWNRFLASQMKEALIEVTAFFIKNGKYTFRVTGEIVKFPGFFQLLKRESSLEQLPDLKEGEVLKLLKLSSLQNFTKPPARYTEGSLVKILEDKGIGRPSTYAKIIDTLGKREYIYKEENKFVPTLLGIQVVEFLEKKFKDIMNYNFTAELESQLDLVSEGNLDWKKGIDNFYKKLENDLAKVSETKESDLYLGKMCPKCNKNLIIKYSHKTHGWFVGCTGYPDCKYTERVKDINKVFKSEEKLNEKCPKPECGKPLVKRYSSKTKKYFIGCSGYPKCTYIKGIKENLGDCPECGKPLINRYSKKTRRFFTGCSGYPDCKYIKKKKK